ncbi:Sulfide dehydrogenase [flavocytochrome c] flavoprotein chain precursor [Marinobacter litoralis]|uniref:Sulfide dehydrogenase [flavocytochrome c] flavoprotein chain n=1 Tax=Marinobacter litoralis TaxID=187981 RepID=A0A3M2RLT8_9GAMM|nr:FAD/NAD(P)-binding oxidoreductase [Marinobacter litoralis]RMJ06313.1 Sulfide dehydrogenase [flavocytochrome c] flavoprotein chain precursor [Marinobacter litoralis]
MAHSHHHQIVVVGAGAAGTSVAASLLRQNPQLEVAIIEPNDIHYYQPAFTLVGGGAYALSKAARPQAQTLPEKARWVRASVESIQPDSNALTLSDGRVLGYDVLVVTPGLKLNWDAVEGLRETLGRNGVCSNYDPSLAEYTWKCIQEFSGGKALFTQAPAPIKCAGAPQKIAYLAADHFNKKGLGNACELKFYAAAGALFSVPDFVPPLTQVAKRHNIGLLMNHNLIAIDGEKKEALFRFTNSQGEITDVKETFDLLHVTPPQCAPDFLQGSPLANDAGWVDVDQYTLQHVRFANVFSLGDASSLPTSKTAAAVRKQSPVAAANVLSFIKGEKLKAQYDGYTSCPVVTGYGKVMLAEFVYGGKVTPTLPLSPFKESRFYWQVKKRVLPPFYFDYMLKGKEGDIAHRPLN